LMMLVALIIFLVLFIDGGIAGIAFIWSLIVPFLACMLVGLPKAWYWIISYFFILIALIAAHMMHLIILPYTNDVLPYFFSAFFFFSLVAAAFEAQFERLHVRYEGSINTLQDLQSNLEYNIQKRTIALQKSNKKLQSEVQRHEETANELKESEERFFQAQKMETIGTLVGGIAHDFNNMLAGINANLFMIKREAKEGSNIQRRSVDIEQLVMRASDMIKQLLTFARKDHVELERLDLVSFITEAFKLAEVSISENIQTGLENNCETLLIQGNKTQLQQVLMNMLNNARDAVKDESTPVILVKVDKYVPNQVFKQKYPNLTAEEYATITVIDNGKGIPEGEVDKVFEPFYSTKEVGKGTGLGLAMCYWAIQSHGGTIRVQSMVGQGTGFKIYIPICNQLEDATLDKGFHESGTLSIGLGETILLVDYDHALRDSQKEALVSLGYHVLEAKHGKDAVALFEKYHDSIHLVITDVTMPVMGGVEAVEHMREIKPDVRAVFVTGYDKDDTLNGERLPGVEEFVLNKPYTIDKLNKVIQQQLRMVS
ncbi:MAG: ATP-binding protein, partial [Ghiorsea sp.]|nr:ATP-binding protein [Ghiorsea sp.]